MGRAHVCALSLAKLETDLPTVTCPRRDGWTASERALCGYGNGYCFGETSTIRARSVWVMSFGAAGKSEVLS